MRKNLTRAEKYDLKCFSSVKILGEMSNSSSKEDLIKSNIITIEEEDT